MTKRNGTITLTGDYRRRIHARSGQLSPMYTRIGQYILDRYWEAAFQTGAQVAQAVAVSASEVTKFAQALGYGGYPGLQASVREHVQREMAESCSGYPGSQDGVRVHVQQEAAEGYGDLDPYLRDIVTELRRAEQVWPDWPADIVHRVAIVAEEAGELVRVANDIGQHGVDRPETWDHLRREAVQTGAMVLRLLINLPDTCADDH